MAKNKKGRLAKKKANESSGKPKIAKKKKQSLLSKATKKQEKLAVLKLTQAFAKSIQVKDDNEDKYSSFEMEHDNLMDRRQGSQQKKKKKPKQPKKVTIEASGKKTALTFAPATFTLTKSTRQLLEETVQGLGGFGVSNSDTKQHQQQRPTFILPPPPNTPIVHKNPFSTLADHEDAVEPPPTLTFQPARFDASIDPDL